MKNRKFRNILIFVILLVTVYYLIPLLPIDLPEFWTEKRIRLGLDLQGGMQIMLEVEYDELPEAEKDDAVRSAVEIVRNRIDQFGVAEPSIQRIGRNRIMVQLPGLQEFERAKELIGRTALLEFKLLATGEQVEQTRELLDNYLKENAHQYPYLERFILSDPMDDPLRSILDEEDEEEEEEAVDSRIFTRLTSSQGLPMMVSNQDLSIVQRLLESESFLENVPAGLMLALERENRLDPRTDRELFVLLEKTELTGNMLETAAVRIGSGTDLQAPNRPYVSLRFNREGARIFENVTGQNLRRRLAIVLDGVVYTAPTIQDRIRGGEARITGNFTIEETNDLVIVLRAGNLPAPVNVIEERTVGPTLGADSVRSGLTAAILGLIIVMLFIIVYYKVPGIIANIALIVNMGIIMAALTLLGAALTMPGIAGIILTIGMAVDANVLIFERIREELKSGKTVRTAVDAGFSRAIVTILDANITTLITAVVLYQFGTGPIRGFAVTLSLGILASMFTAIVMVKALFEAAITNKNRTTLSI
ncbi:MAG: protein translocase subunit SecD [Candidatus Cloacimonetes bacterium]|nr:protein translocase subunit SecD [Candidatus Cloacimonadota bacterium]